MGILTDVLNNTIRLEASLICFWPVLAKTDQKQINVGRVLLCGYCNIVSFGACFTRLHA